MNDVQLVERSRTMLLTARASEPAVRESPVLPDPDAIARAVDQVLGEYDQPGRHHHGRRHLAEVLTEIDRLVAVDERWWQVPVAVELAVLFHDVVYDPTATDNEERSAQVAGETLSDLGVAATIRDEVTRLVRVTRAHAPDDADPAGQLLTDGDLWILAAPPERYDRYRHDVRAEYAHLPDRAWWAGRKRVLGELADRLDRHGYQVGPSDDRARRTVAALDNIDRELDVWRESAHM